MKRVRREGGIQIIRAFHKQIEAATFLHPSLTVLEA